MKLVKSKLCMSLAMVAGGMSCVGGAAVAQTTGAQSLERVEVTGSNIRRINSETASPVQTITRDEIARSGKATIGDYLQTLTADGQGSVPTGFGNGFASGSQGISLRGLGAGSTLILVNGRRIAPYGLADDGQKVFTDLSIIPTEAVERVEILKDGASAIYGSDAIAGVVNIILRRDFVGFSAKGSAGTSRYGDGDQTRGSITIGGGDLATDKVNGFLNFEYTRQDRIAYADRDRKYIGDDDTRKYGYAQGGSNFTPGGNIAGGVPGSSKNGAVLANGANPARELPGCTTFQPVILPADPNGGCLSTLNKQYRDMIPAQDTYNLFGRATFAVNPAFELYFEGNYGFKRSNFHNTPSAVSGSWGYPGGAVNASSGAGATVLGPNHPDNPFPGTSPRLRYVATDVGPRVSDVENSFYRLLGGARGSVYGFDYDAAYLHSETDLTNTRTGFLRYSVLRSLLTNTPANSLYPYRIGINAGLNSPALYAALSPTIHADGAGSSDIVDLKVSRELFQLPGGPLGLAFGGEFRREKTSLTPQTYTDQGDIVGLGYSAYNGTRNLWAGYAEVLAPIIKEVEASAAVRYDHYNGSSTKATPKVGLKITPIPQIAVRGTYAEGFRIPNAAEQAGVSAGFTTSRDPLRCPNGATGPFPTGATSADCNVSVALITTGNPGLRPETSKNYTLGLILEPVAGTSVSVDYYQIRRNDEINQSTVTAGLASGGAVRSDNNLPGVPNSGTLLAVAAPYLNSNSTKIKGFDVDLRQRMTLGSWGRIDGEVTWTRDISFVRTDPGGTRTQWAGTHGNCDVSNCIGQPRDRVSMNVAYEYGPYQVATIVNYRGVIRNIDAADQVGCNNSYANGDVAPTGCKISSFTSIDLSGRYRLLGNKLEIFGSVQNVFDKIAPIDPHTYGAVNFNPLDYSGAIGRYYTLGLRYRFY